MTDIDLKRLAVDREYWDSLAPEGSTHYSPHAQRFIKECKSCYMAFLPEHRGGEWVAIESPVSHQYIPRPAKQEWDGEGLPPVGVECCMTLGFVEYDHVKITYMGDGVFCYLNMRTELEYTGALCDATFRPLKSQQERQRDSLAELCRTKFNQQTSSSNPYLWRQIADAILSRYNLEPKP